MAMISSQVFVLQGSHEATRALRNHKKILAVVESIGDFGVVGLCGDDNIFLYIASYHLEL